MDIKNRFNKYVSLLAVLWPWWKSLGMSFVSNQMPVG